MTAPLVRYAVEGRSDVGFAEVLLRCAGAEPRVASDSGGKSELDRRLLRWKEPSNRAAFFVVRDWDDDDGVPCAPALVEHLIGSSDGSSPALCLRIAVRSIESWALADHEGFAEYFSVHSALPKEPDGLAAPKLEIVRLCARSRKRDVRDAMVPTRGVRAPVGPEYVERMRSYAREAWSPERAAVHSPSLRRALDAVRAKVDAGHWS